MALALAIAVAAGAAGTVSMKALAAADFTQAKTPSQVNYGTLTDSQLEIVKAHFDADFYANKYDDVVNALGTDKEILFKHFVMCGIWEGRRGWADFDPAAYASAYSDLKDNFGNDIPKYYSHFYNKGLSEGRNLTTIDECENEGITVVSFFDEDALLPVNVFAASNLMETADYDTVSDALNAVTSNGAATVTAHDTTYVIVPTEVADNTLADTADTTVEDDVVDNANEAAINVNPDIVKSVKKAEIKENVVSEETTEETTEEVTEETTEEVAQVEEPHFEELGEVYVSNGQGGVKECAILVLRNGTGYEPKLVRNMESDMEGIDPMGIVAIVPVVIFTVEEANNIIKNENYDAIPLFEAESGNVIGSEGVTFKDDYSGLNYHMPVEEESSFDKMMTNYVDGGYADNAPVAVDEEGYDGTDYEISADVRADENGDAKVTAIVKSGDEVKYKATYVFEGTALNTEADAVDTVEEAENTEETETVESDSDNTAEEDAE